ncbi:hypothetical protein PHLGIDRAFT_313832 [Phlebiopsis gigantea 11061_1 CR5-6]|uniref:Uncharacterized protein n=1 Tax=Phlebiopsis gigantea (strain 11061_1 CR5-6) TaxID=745531 RepID=A0A0C3RZT0_PHLG1|nr:hypothetical protein PHLGIDRAFT_313832 [Phlebiopsis gigantea 11061_1 CR5-6]
MKPQTAALAPSVLAIANGAHTIVWTVFDGQPCTGSILGTVELLNVTAAACIQQSGASVNFTSTGDSVPCTVALYKDSTCTDFEGAISENACLLFGAKGAVVQAYLYRVRASAGPEGRR